MSVDRALCPRVNMEAAVWRLANPRRFRQRRAISICP
jgi:hypothetical protein